MGKRGIGSRAKSKGKPEDFGPFPWDDTDLPMSERFLLFAESLPISSGKLAGQNMRLRDWQKDMLRPVLDRQRDGRRIIRTALFSFPRKNGKTQLAAVLALAFLCGPLAEERGQIYSAASDRNQASLIFRELEAIITRVPWLDARLNIRRQIKTVEDELTGSFYEALSSDARKAHGLNPSCVIADEIAQWRSRELWDNLVSGMDAREQPLIIGIGTQSPDDNSLMSELVDYVEKLNSGEMADETFHGVVYAAPPDSDPWDEKTWLACNPALGDFKDIVGMRAQAAQAQRIPAQAAAFKNLHLNQRIDGEVRFIAADDWLACGDPVELSSLYGKRCWCGLDLSSTTDLTTVVCYFPDQGGAVLPFFWIPGENIQTRSDMDRVPYRV